MVMGLCCVWLNSECDEGFILGAAHGVKRLPSVFIADLWAMASSIGITMELVRNRLSLTSVLQNQNLLCSSSLEMRGHVEG